MCQKETNTMVCASNSGMQGNFVIWFGAKIRHVDNRRVVQNFCGSACRFPECLEQIVLPPQAGEHTIDVSADDRVRGENWSHARSLFDERDPE